MSKYTVIVTDHDFEDLSIERAKLGDIAEVRTLSQCTEQDDIHSREYLATADAVINLRYHLDTEDIAIMDNCNVISRYGIGVDNIDTEAAARQEIPVTNVPDYCKEEVANHVMMLLLAFARSLNPYHNDVAMGNWDRSVGTPIHRFSTQTVGIVGYGTIGREVGHRAAALGAEVLVTDPFLDPEDVSNDPVQLVKFDKLLNHGNFITIHSPLTEATRGMFNQDVFSRMKRSSYLINVARGPIVDDDDLLAALDNGEISGAGVDVFSSEPPSEDNPLRDHNKVLATPHVAWYSEEANKERRRTVSQIVRTVLTGGDAYNIVNETK